MIRMNLHHVDVFTTERFCGNPLAVFVDADGLEGELMQKIAREMNLSETTFVQTTSNTNADYKVRIFTPGQELPFAGHPTIGTASVLYSLGRINEDVTFEMGAGLIPVKREGDFFWMTPPPAEALSPAVDRAAVAQAIGLPVSSVMMPPQVFGGRGVQLLIVLLDTPQNVDWVMLNRGDLINAAGEDIANGDILLASYSAGKAYTRMFAALESGIVEDPATGSSIAPLCAALAWWRVIDQSRSEIEIEQGTAMGRQSFIHARFAVEGTAVQQVTVGGSAVPVFESTLTV